MRNRTIKPQFWVDEDLARLPRDARLLYIALWNVADDGGVFEYRPERLKAQLFPYDEIPLDQLCSWLDGLENLGKFIQFSNDGRLYAFLVNFPKHQRIKKPSAYRFALPPSLAVGHESPTSGEGVGHESPTGGTAVPLGSRLQVVGSRLQVVGSRLREQPAAAAVFQTYEDNIGLLTPIVADRLHDLATRASPEWVIEAIGVAVEANVRKLRYVESIIERWLVEGKDNGRPDKNHKGSYRGSKGRPPDTDRFAGITVFNVDEPDVDDTDRD